MSRSSRLVRPGSGRTVGSRLPGPRRQSVGEKLMKAGSDGGSPHHRGPGTGPEPGDGPRSRGPAPVLDPPPGRVQAEEGDPLVPQSRTSPPGDPRTSAPQQDLFQAPVQDPVRSKSPASHPNLMSLVPHTATDTSGLDTTSSFYMLVASCNW